MLEIDFGKCMRTLILILILLSFKQDFECWTFTSIRVFLLCSIATFTQAEFTIVLFPPLPVTNMDVNGPITSVNTIDYHYRLWIIYYSSCTTLCIIFPLTYFLTIILVCVTSRFQPLFKYNGVKLCSKCGGQS